MSAVQAPPQSASFALAADAIPALENGERLGANEFLRRYDAMTDLKKAELIDGIVYLMPSPVSLNHGDPDSLAQGWLGTYAAATPGVKSSTNATTRLGPRDVPQPDGLLRLLPEFGGQSRVEIRHNHKYLYGAPELAFEIAASSSSIDANAKKDSYLRAGVREYILWRTESGEIDWWRLEDDEFRPIEPGEDGILRSGVFPGLWLDPPAMIAEAAAKVLEVLNQGLASPEHAAFAKAANSGASGATQIQSR